jgi:hypothetical protein
VRSGRHRDRPAGESPRARVTGLHGAWDELVEATLPGWYVGTPVYHVERQQWALYAFDTTEKAHIGRRSREWTAVAPSEERVILEMARCLREIGAGRAPK